MPWYRPRLETMTATQAWTKLTGPARPSPDAAAGQSWLLLGLVLAGLFAMHGLGTHGTHSTHGSDSMALATVSPPAPADVSHEGHGPDHAPEQAAVMGVASLAPVVAGAGDGPTGGLLLGLCLAVLAAAYGLLLTLIARRGLAPLRRPVPAPVVLRTPRGRDPDPPDLARLSVRRC